VGVGLSVLVLTIHAMYTWNAFRPMYGTSAPALIAIAVFALVFGAHVAKYNPNSGVIALALLSGLSILCVCGVALWFMVACGNGDCI
jgi:hypothetical protein